MKESDILYERGRYWICLSDDGKAYHVFRTGLTHSTRVATIGRSMGLQRAIEEIARREAKDALF